jgi:HPt (histidine-containing phosphotransfer) domain-containing protein
MSKTLIDLQTWETLKTKTDPGLLVDLIETYLNDTPAMIEQMSIGLESGEIELVQRAAYALKANSLSLGAHQLAVAAHELELIARSGTLDGAEAKLEIIEKTYLQTSILLADLQNKRSG